MVSDCGLSEEDKALYVKYRQKLRDLTTTDEFAADVEPSFDLTRFLQENV